MSEAATIRRATFDRQACIRCGRKISKGDRIEAIRLSGASWNSWVHVGCQSTVPQVAATTPRLETIDTAGMVDQIMGRMAGELQTLDANQAVRLRDAAKALSEYVDERFNRATLPQVIEVRFPDGGVQQVEGLFHEAFPKVLKLAAMGENVYLPGPAGCGKTRLAQQVSQALGRRFGSLSFSAGVSESQIVGRCIPNLTTGDNVYAPSEFVDLYENGGVMLLDELDAADENVLLRVNSALANGYLTIDRSNKPRAEKHQNFVCIAAANTLGRGADMMYTGRNRLDEATLDRFRIGTVPMDYDARVEEAIAKGFCDAAGKPYDGRLLATIRGWRKLIRDNRLQRVASMRFIEQAYRMVFLGGFTTTDVEAAFFAGWSRDELVKMGRQPA